MSSTLDFTPRITPPRAALKVATSKEKKGFAKILDILNRGTEGSASFFDEVIFDPSERSPEQAFWKGFWEGEGSVESFGELLKKSGWEPDSKMGKFLRGAVGLTLDIGLDPTTYITLGTSAVPRGVLKSVGPLIKAGIAVADIEKVLGKGGRKAAEFLIEAQRKASPKEAAVLQKVLAGQDITRAEAAVLGSQSLLGVDFYGKKLLIAPRGASFEAFDKGGKFLDYVKTRPLISPVVEGFTKSFNQFSTELKKRFPEVIEMRQRMREKLSAFTGESRKRMVDVWDAVANPEERELLTRILEEGNIVTGKEPLWFNVTEMVQRSPHIMTDLGFSIRTRLTDEEAVDVVTKYFDEIDSWLYEFGSDGGLYAGFALHHQLASYRKTLEEIREGIKDAIALQDGGALKILQSQEKQLLQAVRGIEDGIKDLATDPLTTRLNEAATKEYERTRGRGVEGVVKGPFDVIRFQNRIIKFPAELSDRAFRESVTEHRAYEAAREIPGIGSASIVWKEFPLETRVTDKGETIRFVAGLQFKPNRALGLEPSPQIPDDPFGHLSKMKDFIVTKTDGRAYLRVPILVKEFVDVDKAATELFSATTRRATKPDRMKILQLEKMLSRLARRGVTPLDLHSGNLVVDTKGKVHLIDLGFAFTKPRNPIGVREAYEQNVNVFASFLRGSYEAPGAVAVHNYHDNLDFLESVGHRLTYLNPKSFSKAPPLIPKKLDELRIRRNLLKRGYSFQEARQVAKAAVERARKEAPPVFEQGIYRVDPERLTALQDEVADLRFELEQLSANPQPLVNVARALGKLSGNEEEAARYVAGEIGRVTQSLSVKEKELTAALELKKLEDPVAVTRPKREFKEITLLDKLSPGGRRALEMVSAWRDEITRTLVDSGFLTEEFVQNFARAHGIEHVPHIRKGDADDLVRQFFAVVGHLGDPKFLKPRKLEGAIEEINDRMGREFFEKDIGKILFARHVAVAEAVENWKYLNDLVDKFGERISPTITFHKGKKIESFHPTKEGYVVLKDHPLFQGVQVPKVIAKDISKIVAFARHDPYQRNYFKWMKTVNTWWKKWQLFVFPSFFLRQVGGGFWNGYLGDINPLSFGESWETIMGQHNIEEVFRSIVQKDRPIQRIGYVAVNGKKPVRGLKGITRQQLLDEFHGQGLGVRGLTVAAGDIERQVWEELADLPRGLRAALSPSPDKNTFVQFGMRVGNWIENWQRYAGYVHFRRKGFGPAEAAAQVKKFFYDPQQLSDTERAIRDYGIPFYSWTRFNLPLQVQQMILRPGKFAALGKTKAAVEREFGGPAPSDRVLPEWLNDQLGVRFRYNKKNGTYEYFLWRSWIPAADVQALFSPVQSFTSMLSPALRVPMEQLFNRSTLYNRPLEEFPGETHALLSPEAGQVLSQIPGADPVAQLLEATLGRPLGFVTAPLKEGVEVRGRTKNVFDSFRAVTESKRLLETTARAGGVQGAAGVALGRAYGIDPTISQRGKVWDKRKQLSLVNRAFLDALEKGQVSKATQSYERMQRIKLELRFLEAGQ